MPSLTDIAVGSETVTIRGLAFPVRGLSAADIAKLLAKFPQLRDAWTNRDVSADQWLKAVPELVPFIIAAGLDKLDDDAEIEAAKTLGAEDQISLLAPIWRLTMPSGLTPFVERLAAMAQGAGVALARVEPSKAPVTK